ncbi:MAG: nitrous oxide reductase accessory protein NosL [Balneolaceae bacterium]|nr:nitrous oxide reductase accessory protein NosL [Balneolaceae bacterium]
MISVKPIFFTGIFLLLTACSQEPATIHYGNDECEHCKMMITDSRFASQIVTDKGKAYTFDAVECMAVYQRQHSNELEGAKLWVNNFDNPGEWLEAPKAQYIKSDVIKSPMGESLLALPSQVSAEKHLQQKPGKLLRWDDVSQIKMHMSNM